MSLRASSNNSLIAFNKFRFQILFSSSNSVNLTRPRIIFSKRFYRTIISFIGNSFYFLLCLSILKFNAHHVVCYELTDKRISKSHLQLHDCCLLQQNYNGIEVNTYEHDLRNSSHAKTSKLIANNSTHPNCIDQHIKYVSSSSETKTDIELLFTIQLINNAIRDIPYLKKFTQILSYLFFLKFIPEPSYLDSIIRTTVLLI